MKKNYVHPTFKQYKKKTPIDLFFIYCMGKNYMRKKN